ncbi:hypothetical protein Selin_2105 [Desulfurispirillum indicum S5]|uniref:Uncharacterized protein n=1 Tax=Desulfurispirillum indicum (strain ATCC BAA-1389 / DSM 22839 / S5) TaxID=653733 RepID=E6W300_DESIS|nr:hypothetical protein [Desulfurispirillum indicum]ADU66825.1 hypothetical protein Selin_2105 [Desulfurispirillum indicum S5]
MDTQVSLKKWILTCFSVLAVALFMVGCGGSSSSSGGGGGGTPTVEAVPQVQLSGLVTKQTVGGSSLSPAALDAPILLIAVDQDGNTSTAIVTTGDYSIMVSKDKPNSLMILDLGTMSFLGALLSGEGLGSFTLSANTDEVEFEVDDAGTVSVATASQDRLTVAAAPEKLQDAFDPATGIDTNKLQADPTKVQHIAFTDFLPRAGTWTTGYDEWKESGTEVWEGVTVTYSYAGVERNFSLVYRNESNNLRQVNALFYEYWKDTWSATGYGSDTEECGGFFAGVLQETDECWGYYHGTTLTAPGFEVETFADTYIIDSEKGVIYFGGEDEIPLPIQLTAGTKFTVEDAGEDDWETWDNSLECVPNIMGNFTDTASNNVNVLRLRCDMSWSWEEKGDDPSGGSGTEKIDVYMLSRYGSFIVVDQGTSNWQTLVANHARFGTFDLTDGTPFTDLTPTSIGGVSVSGAIPGNPSSGNTAEMRNTWLQELWNNRDSIYSWY